MIREQRALSHSLGDEHPFDGFKLEKLGTHSFKYTGVSLMKDVSSSTALVGAVAGTSAKTLDRIYDSATIPRQLSMVRQAFRNLRKLFLESWWHMPFCAAFGCLVCASFCTHVGESCTHRLMGLAFTLSVVSQHQQTKLPD